MDLCYEDVSYKNIINNVSFTLKSGKSLGIMGATGSGKSVLISFLSRFLDPNGGKITLGGVNIKDLTLSYLRNSISFVSQDVFLFSDTIKNNLTKALENSSIDDINSACQISMAMKFIKDLDKGLDTEIGERGVGLSGGQKQRLTIARAIIRKPSILILDDSTSALDIKTEREFQNNLKNIKASKIIIAHRITSVKDCDEIIILDKGKIVERGTHEELIKKCGAYYKTYVTQYGLERA